jgi:hypothetical protein
MTRSALGWIILLLILAPEAVSAQRTEDACTRDVARHCRAVVGNGDQVVLACLKQNRGRLSKACDKLLTEHGQ